LLSPMLGIFSKVVRPWDCLTMPKMQSIRTIWNKEIFGFKLWSKGVGCFDNLYLPSRCDIWAVQWRSITNTTIFVLHLPKLSFFHCHIVILLLWLVVWSWSFLQLLLNCFYSCCLPSQGYCVWDSL
jgi:hypothetical protein